jgi:hypothetical protein
VGEEGANHLLFVLLFHLNLQLFFHFLRIYNLSIYL